MRKQPAESVLLSVAVVAGFFTLGLLGILRHEMWRDELEIWLIARDSGSLADLLANMRTEAHPVLWYALTWVIARLTQDPLFMQLLSLLIGTALVWIFFTNAPFPRSQRLLFCFGYFPLYEYTVISRNYGLQWLLAFLFCALFARARGRWLGQAVVVLLLAHTHIYGIIFATVLGLLLLTEILPAIRTGEPGMLRRGALALAVAFSGIALAAGHVLYQVVRIGSEHRPPVADWSLRWLADSLSTIYQGYVPIPDVFDPHFWNTNILSSLPGAVGVPLGAALGALLFVGSCLLLRQKPVALAAFLLASAPMLALTFFFWNTHLRHHGQLFLLFVACFWLAQHLPENRARPGGAVVSGLITAVLAAHVAAGAYAYGADLVRPFSNGRAVGAYLQRPELRDAVLVGSVDFTVQSVAAYVDRPLYHPESGRFRTFVDWGEQRRHVPSAAVLRDAVALLRERHGDVVVILCYEVGRPRSGEVVSLGPHASVEALARFEGAIVEDENFFLYRVFDPGPRR